MKSKQYLYNIFHIHSSQFLILMAQKSEKNYARPRRHHSTSPRQAAGRQFDRMWRQLLLDDSDTKNVPGAMECSPPPLWKTDKQPQESLLLNRKEILFSFQLFCLSHVDCHMIFSYVSASGHPGLYRTHRNSKQLPMYDVPSQSKYPDIEMLFQKPKK